MIPILYDAALSDATFITNGICRLSDTISCKVTEERNGAYTLEMEYPFGGIHADELTVQRIVKAKANDISDLQCFRIASVTQSLDGKRLNVKANHISYDLSYFPVTPFNGVFNSVAYAITGILNNAVNPSGFFNSADYVPGDAVSYSISAPRSIKACLGGQAGSVLDIFGGEYEWDNRLIKWHTARGQDRGVTIRYGKNLTNYEQETNIEDTVCGILPVYNMDNVVVYGDIQYSDNASSFPFLKVAVMDFTSDFTSTDGESTAPTPAQLEARAAAYIEANNIGQPEVSIDVEFYPIWQTEDYAEYKALETVGLCDTVTVIFPDLNVRTKAKVVKTVYNTLLEKYISVSLGSIRRNIADTIAEMEDSSGGSSSGGGGSVNPYPVGSIYLSVNNVNPSTLFGGTWEQIQDTFLLAAGSTFAAGDTGGAQRHTHNYGIQYGGYYRGFIVEYDNSAGLLKYDSAGNVSIQPAPSDAILQNVSISVNNNLASAVKTIRANHYRIESNTSYGSNLPPYLAVYVWKRVA